jgi:hypothetical protein
MLVTELISPTLLSTVQLLNAPSPIVRAPDGHVNERNATQLLNAFVPIFITELILVIAVNAVQLKNALFPIFIKPVAIEQSTLVKTGLTEAVEKDELPIDVTENNNVAAVDPEPLYVTVVITVFVFESEYVYVKLLLLTAAVIAAALNPAVVKSPDEYPCKSIPIKGVYPGYVLLIDVVPENESVANVVKGVINRCNVILVRALQLSNAYSPMLDTELGTITRVKALQEENVKILIDVAPVGQFNICKPLLRNAASPILVTVFGIAIIDKLEQLSNAFDSILVTELIFPTLVKALQKANVELLIIRAPDGHEIDLKALCDNAPSSMLVTELIPVIAVNAEHWENIFSGIVRAPDGHENDGNAEHWTNTSIPKLVTELIPVILVINMQLLNALA